MRQRVEETERDAILVEDAALIHMMGMPVLEAVPSRRAPYELTDPFILVHDANGREAKPPQLVLLGPGDELNVTDATPGTRFMLMTGQPYGEAPLFNGPFVD
jgi:hypothetical protein